MKIFICFLSFAIFTSPALADNPLTLETRQPIDSIHPISKLKASPTVPFAALSDSVNFWMFDIRGKELMLLAQNEAEDWSYRIHHFQWSGSQLLMFDNWADALTFVDPTNDQRTTLPAKFESAPLRRTYWLDSYPLLLDETNIYSIEHGALTPVKKPNLEFHGSNTGLIIQDDTNAITSGFHDQSIKVWSLPKGELLKDWTLGSWFSSRKITTIALVHNRLLVGLHNGKIEERSLEDGKKLWSTKPCKDGVDFHYSSQFLPSPSINVDDDIFFSCDNKIGYLTRKEEKWITVDITKAIYQKIPPTHERENRDGVWQAENLLTGLETIPKSGLVILVFDNGNTVVWDKQQQQVVQQLADVGLGIAPVSYVAATHQLLLVDKSNAINLYDVTTKK